MAHEAHSHHHSHPHPVVIPASILRMSAPERLALAVVVIAVMWATVFWAMAQS